MSATLNAELFSEYFSKLTLRIYLFLDAKCLHAMKNYLAEVWDAI